MPEKGGSLNDIATEKLNREPFAAGESKMLAAVYAMNPGEGLGIGAEAEYAANCIPYLL